MDPPGPNPLIRSFERHLYAENRSAHTVSQYLTFQLDIPGHGQVVRNYSVSCAPGQDYSASVSSATGPRTMPPRLLPALPPTTSMTRAVQGRWCG
jgi:ferredoxin-NADP reductase